jgi:uncharacterized protein (DUF849 family)
VDPVIIEVAVNGATRPSVQRHVPVTPEQIALDGIGCVDAGAAIVHHHDDPRATQALGGGPEAMGTLGLATYAGLLSARPGTLVYPTARFDGRTIADRWDHHRFLAEQMPQEGLGPLRLGLVDPGTVTLGNFTYGFTRDEVAYKLDTCRDLGIGPSVACFEPGYIRVFLDFYASGRVPPGSLVKFYFCAGPPLFGLPPSEAALDLYVDLLAGTGLPWAVAVLGGDVVGSGMARWAIERGGHVRVGLEDFSDPKGPVGRQPANAELVAEVADLARANGRGVATSADADRILRLPSPAF